jgi:hypothetical protein
VIVWALAIRAYPPYVSKALTNADAWLEMPTEEPEELVEAVNSLAAEKRN